MINQELEEGKDAEESEVGGSEATDEGEVGGGNGEKESKV